MRLILDENLPHKLRALIAGHECATAAFMGWSGVENGQLLRLAADHGFEAFVTTDKGFEHEQNLAALPLAVVVLVAKDNKLQTIESLVPRLLESLGKLRPRSLVKVVAGP